MSSSLFHGSSFSSFASAPMTEGAMPVESIAAIKDLRETAFMKPRMRTRIFHENNIGRAYCRPARFRLFLFLLRRFENASLLGLVVLSSTRRHLRVRFHISRHAKSFCSPIRASKKLCGEFMRAHRLELDLPARAPGVDWRSRKVETARKAACFL